MIKNNFHFAISERKVLLRIFDIVSVLVLLHICGNIFDFDYFIIDKSRWMWPIVLALYLTVFATIFELYDLQKASKYIVVIKNVVLAVSITVLFYLLTPFFTPSLPSNRLQIVFFYLTIVLALLLWRYSYITFISAPRFNKRVLLVGQGEMVPTIVSSLINSDPNCKVVCYFDTSSNNTFLINSNGEAVQSMGGFSQIYDEMQISEVIICTISSEDMSIEIHNNLVKFLERGISIREYSQVYEELNHRIPIHASGVGSFYRYFPFSRNNQNQLYLFFSRLMDIILSIIGLVFGILLLPIILIGNLIGNKGPLLYHQTRVGRNGKTFKLHKLRSMVKNAEENGVQFAKKGDNRVTKFGRFLRNSRYDEIPQFINVLKGEMSVIGPRPERPEFVHDLSVSLPLYEVRHLVKPGITGWAQVKGQYGASLDDALEKLQYDLYYIKHRSMFLDALILLKTLSTIIFFRGQ
ncbi:exopolysaccharide biosynthesis polyprenyl glycosylphosphotransferase [Aequorivita sp. H23M31]|uniref:Exopolysaccharide biosynthesis polyprenyl glycosylphosphotransferase n=1 Tax=Aequorivita ciconiae TaxID=2494375 RepID=A0A410G2F3_9FLAO|nr:exopolysaccharide biosynthesis polyprenyl glycosylphosphotransferase [Aequorivita sp. H23M31]QAA81464.1 exopolysaccharide biosynthesis polyprenyl glycosylphosphotransferase [Aequorivita sp. H23M31]